MTAGDKRNVNYFEIVGYFLFVAVGRMWQLTVTKRVVCRRHTLHFMRKLAHQQ